KPGRVSPTVRENFPTVLLARPGNFFRIDCHDDALIAEFLRRLLYEAAPVNRRCIDRYLVGTTGQELPNILDRAYPAAASERHEPFFSCAVYDIIDGFALFMARRNIKEKKLVCSRRVVDNGRLHGIPGVAKVDEIYPFDHTAIFHI